jgi:hypothetical protein
VHASANTDRRLWGVIGGFFVSGAVFHGLLYWLYATSISFEEARLGIANFLVLLIFVSLVGGSTWTWLMTLMAKAVSKRRTVKPFRVVLETGCVGMGAVLSVGICYFLLVSFILAIAENGIWAPLTVLFIFMGVVVYGMNVLIYAMPFGFAFGSVTGAVALMLRRVRIWDDAEAEKPRPQWAPLVFAVLGLILILVPIVGVACSAVAVILALRAWMRRREIPDLPSSWSLALGLALGLVGLVLRTALHISDALSSTPWP